jgi:hypothetical protein
MQSLDRRPVRDTRNSGAPAVPDLGRITRVGRLVMPFEQIDRHDAPPASGGRQRSGGQPLRVPLHPSLVMTFGGHA